MITSTAAFADLRRFGEAPALLTAGGTLSFSDVAERIDASREQLTTEQRLVLIGGANTVDAVLAYASAMAHGHTVMLVPTESPAHFDSLVAAYDPDVVFDPTAGVGFVERREGTRHDLHPDLSLLLSTSGSTGSPKFVRLSRNNVVSNASSITEFLRIDGDDRAMMTLPMHYSYGLSVVNSHLLTGAGLVVTDLSVLDECLWTLFSDTAATSFAGVPYTFDLLDSTGFSERDLPSLRYVTQAGGRLAPERIGAYARLGAERGWDFVAMYGQTEATARMAYLPPELAMVSPHALGIAVPGGSFRLDPVPESVGAAAGSGELVYSGPNVMMGYATGPADLSRGAELGELRTGDLAVEHTDGTYEWVGRRSRIAKIFGLRIDLDDLERCLSSTGLDARCVAMDNAVHVFVEGRVDRPTAQATVSELCGLPLHAIGVEPLVSLPRTPAGKVDYAALERKARLRVSKAAEADRPASCRDVSVDQIRDLYALLLGKPNAVAEDSFVSLGGDSLSYVEVSLRLGELGLAIPGDWNRLTIRELAELGPTEQSRGVRLEMSILLRGVAILLILASHANFLTAPGGAHLLLAIAGYHFARFQVGGRRRLERVRSGLVAIAHVIVPSMIWIGAVALVAGAYKPTTVVFLNGFLGSNHWDDDWQFWFLEAIVWTQLAALLLLAVPWVHRAQRRSPFGFAMTCVVAALVVRYVSVGVQAGAEERYTLWFVLWCFAIGWAAAVADRPWQRLMVSLASIVAVLGFFGDGQREAVVVAGILLLIWFDSVRVPRWFARGIGVLASASLYIYLTHWQIYPHLENRLPIAAVLASIVGGIVYQRICDSARSRLSGVKQPAIN